MVSAKGLNRKDLLNIGARNPKLDHNVLQNLLLSGIHESLHNNSVDLTEIFKIVGNPKLDHSVLPKHERKNGGNVVARKNEDASKVSNFAANAETIPNHDPRTVGKNKMLGGFNVSSIAAPTNGSQNVERRRMRVRNRVIGGFNVTDIGDDAKAKEKIDKKNEKHAFPWIVRVFGDCGGM